MKRILVVEDDPSLMNAAAITLSRQGYKILKATSVRDAKSVLEKEGTVDAVWLDHYLLDNGTGLDFLAEVRANRKWDNIAIFVVTNSVSDDKVRKYYLLGIEKYYIKAENKLNDIIGDIDGYFEKSERDE